MGSGCSWRKNEKEGGATVLNFEETRTILTILKTNYPQSFKGWSEKQGKMFLEMWSEAFQNDKFEIVATAVKSIIYADTREFAPNVGQVKEKIMLLTNPVSIDADKAWALVYKALRNSIYDANKEFSKLPPEVQAGVGSASQLKEWAKMDVPTLESVIASNFKKGYRGRVKEHRDFQKLPDNAKQLIQNMTTKMLINKRKDES